MNKEPDSTSNRPPRPRASTRDILGAFPQPRADRFKANDGEEQRPDEQNLRGQRIEEINNCTD